MRREKAGLVVSAGGWVMYQEPPGVHRRIWARLGRDQSGRLRVHTLLIDSKSALDGAALRSVKVGQIEALVNSPLYREEILERFDVKVQLMWQVVETGEMHDRLAEAVETVRRRARPLLLSTPSETPYPNHFYRRVADAYGAAATYSNRPAVEIAEVNDVPVERVHGWIRAARKRGLLAPGRKRKEA